MKFNDLTKEQKFQLRKWFVVRHFGRLSWVEISNRANNIPDSALLKEFGNKEFSEDDFVTYDV